MIVVAEPVGSDLSKIVLRLGGFHTEMSFLGCIGHLMASSGLQDLLSLIYSPNAVVHMLTGKAIARAVRGHLIVDAALNALLLSRMLNVQLPVQTAVDDTETDESIASVPSQEDSITDVEGDSDLDELSVLYEHHCRRMKCVKSM